MKRLIVPGAAMAALLVSGCQSDSDLHLWVQQQQAEAKTKVKKPQIPAPPVLTPYQPPPYIGLNAFDARRLSLAQQTSSGAGAPNLGRPKEILEGVGLESLEYVGNFIKNGQKSAFIRSNGYVYTVHAGNYLGTNYGRITDIQPEKIILIETVENADGGWTTRKAEIPLGAPTGAQANPALPNALATPSNSSTQGTPAQ